MRTITSIVMFAVVLLCVSSVSAFTSGSTTICESWTRVSNDPNHEDYWNFTPKNPKTTWYDGESPIIVSQILNPTGRFSWRTDLYLNGRLMTNLPDDFISAERNAGAGWNQASFIPQLKNAAKGSYVAKTWTDTASGAVLVDEKSFEVIARPGVHTPDAVMCENIAPGGAEGSSEYWNTRPVNKGTTFKPGQQIYMLINKAEIFESHYWISYFYYGAAEEPFLTRKSDTYTPAPEGQRYSPWYVMWVYNELGKYTVKTYLVANGQNIVSSTVSFNISNTVTEPTITDTVELTGEGKAIPFVYTLLLSGEK